MKILIETMHGFEGVNGIMFPVRDVDRAVELVEKQLHTNIVKPKQVKKMFSEKFSVERMVCKIEELYSIKLS